MEATERMLLVPFFVDEDGRRARDLFGPRVEWFYAKVTQNQLAGAPSVVPGYELTMTGGRRTRELGYLSFDKLHEHGAAIAERPGDVRREAARAEAPVRRHGVRALTWRRQARTSRTS